MNRTKIEWVRNPDGTPGYVWNPIVGCKTGCEYCYARKIHKRFEESPKFRGFKFENVRMYPGLFEETNFPKKHSTIFVNSMSDPMWWERWWLNAVLDKIREYPRHFFLMLTKFPEVYESIQYDIPNLAAGITVTKVIGNTDECDDKVCFGSGIMKRFLSIEPIQSEFDFNGPGMQRSLKRSDLVILGCETGKPVNKIFFPRPEWITGFMIFCYKSQIRLFIKDNFLKAGLKLHGWNYISRNLPDWRDKYEGVISAPEIKCEVKPC